MKPAYPQERQEIGKILQVSPQGNWDINDLNSEQGLAIVSDRYWITHDNPLRGVRGMVMDYKNGNIVCSSYPAEQRPKESDFIRKNSDGSFGLYRGTLPSGTLFYPGFNGIVVRIFRHGGKTYLSNLRSLDIQEKQNGIKGHKTFHQMFQECCKLDPDTIFDSEKKYSPWVLLLMISHPDLVSASRMDYPNGMTILLGINQEYHPNDSPYPSDQVQWEKPKIEAMEEMEIAANGQLPFQQDSINHEQATRFLQRGFENPKYFNKYNHRLSNGEFVLARLPSKEIVEIHSRAYSYRSFLNRKSFNVRKRFYELTDDANMDWKHHPKKHEPNFLYRYPYLRVSWDDFDEETPRRVSKYEDKLKRIWVNYCYALSPFRRPKAIPLLEEFLSFTQEVTEKLYRLFRAGETTGHRNLDRCLDLLRQDLRKNVSRGEAVNYISTMPMSGTELYHLRRELIWKEEESQ